jgi:hypothetical protein
MDDLGLGGGLGWSHGDKGCDMVLGTEPGNMDGPDSGKQEYFFLARI